MRSIEITVHGQHYGLLEICYLQEQPAYDEGPFLKEEREPLEAITERLERIIEQKQAEQALKASEAQYRLLWEGGPAILMTMRDSTANRLREIAIKEVAKVKARKADAAHKSAGDNKPAEPVLKPEQSPVVGDAQDEEFERF